MKSNNGNKFWGIFFICIGVLIGLSEFNLVELSEILTGWWTLLIIVPCLVSMFKNGIKVSNSTILVIGILLFLTEKNIVDEDITSNLIFPVILVGIGFNIIFKNKFVKIDTKEESEESKDKFGNK